MVREVEMRRERTAEWIEERMNAIFRAFPRDAVDRAIPLLLLLMARDFGFDALRPELQEVVRRIAVRIGLTEGMDEDLAKSKTVVYVHNLAIDPELLRQVKQVFDTHYAARAEASAEGFRRVLTRARPGPAPVARAGAEDSIMSAELLRRATGMIRS